MFESRSGSRWLVVALLAVLLVSVSLAVWAANGTTWSADRPAPSLAASVQSLCWVAFVLAGACLAGLAALFRTVVLEHWIFQVAVCIPAVVVLMSVWGLLVTACTSAWAYAEQPCHVSLFELVLRYAFWGVFLASCVCGGYALHPNGGPTLPVDLLLVLHAACLLNGWMVLVTGALHLISFPHWLDRNTGTKREAESRRPSKPAAAPVAARKEVSRKSRHARDTHTLEL